MVKPLNFNLDTIKFELKNNYNIFYFFSKFHFLDVILNPLKYEVVPSFFEQNTLISTYNKYLKLNFHSSKILLECSTLGLLNGVLAPSQVPLPSITILECWFLDPNAHQVPLPPISLEEELFLIGVDPSQIPLPPADSYEEI